MAASEYRDNFMKNLMKKSETLLVRYWQDERAVTAIEYGVLAASIAIGIGALFSSDGGFMPALEETFNKITEQLKSSSQ